MGSGRLDQMVGLSIVASPNRGLVIIAAANTKPVDKTSPNTLPRKIRYTGVNKAKPDPVVLVPGCGKFA
jgi:hypothetical protein